MEEFSQHSSMPPQRPSYKSVTREYTLAEWEAHREWFTDFYVGKDMKLPEVQKTMVSVHGFYATERQYKRKIKAWKLDKNIKEADMKIMLEKQLKRKRVEGKDTEFQLNGRAVPSQKMARFSQRKGLTEDEIMLEQIPTPGYISYQTPKATEQEPCFDVDSYENNRGLIAGYSPRKSSAEEDFIDERLLSPESINSQTLHAIEKISASGVDEHEDSMQSIATSMSKTTISNSCGKESFPASNSSSPSPGSCEHHSSISTLVFEDMTLQEISFLTARLTFFLLYEGFPTIKTIEVNPTRSIFGLMINFKKFPIEYNGPFHVFTAGQLQDYPPAMIPKAMLLLYEIKAKAWNSGRKIRGESVSPQEMQLCLEMVLWVASADLHNQLDQAPVRTSWRLWGRTYYYRRSGLIMLPKTDGLYPASQFTSYITGYADKEWINKLNNFKIYLENIWSPDLANYDFKNPTTKDGSTNEEWSSDKARITDSPGLSTKISQPVSGINNSPLERCSPRYHLSLSSDWYSRDISSSNPLSRLSPIPIRPSSMKRGFPTPVSNYPYLSKLPTSTPQTEPTLLAEDKAKTQHVTGNGSTSVITEGQIIRPNDLSKSPNQSYEAQPNSHHRSWHPAPKIWKPSHQFKM
ncbi:hypothetical protein G7Y89_g2195 [Cudoniella acicularis]|uniref:Clr5 domain-containing protein n=1 Tax=Cudoniella acicularis TaxID=354080 RepID=A0A8H4RTT7_9HELO|nr:hypothetical protein G7Y89_g2195 [Cudoniella acicularis]